MSRLIPTLISLILFYSAPRAQDCIRLSLKEVIEIGMQNNPELLLAGYNVNSSQYAVKESKGNFLPKVKLNGSYNRYIDRPVIFLPEGLGRGGATKIGSDNNFTTSIDMSVPLYSRCNFTNKSYAYHSLQLQNEMLRGVRQQLTANIKKAYFSYLLALEVLQVRFEVLKMRFEILGMSRPNSKTV